MIKNRFLQLFAKDLYVKFSPTYYQTLKFLQKTEYLPEESIKTLQLRLLKNTLIHAYEKVPYYRVTFSKAGLDPHDIDKLGDIHVYPFLTKNRYRQNIDKFILTRQNYTGDVLSISEVAFQLLGGLRSGMGLVGAKDIETLRTKTSWAKITAAGVKESHPHGVTITEESPNYSGR